MPDVTNTENAATPDGSPPGESSAVLVTPEPAVAAPAVEASSVKPDPDTIDDDGLSDDEDPGETEDDEIDVEPHEVPRHFSAPALLPIERLSTDETFCIRSQAELEDVTALATDIARLGQLFPIDVRLVAPDTIQIVTGFRRVAALKFLQREKVVARLHTELSDTDAMLMAIASAIHSRSVSPDALRAVQEQLEAQGKLIPAARDMLAKALATDDELSPENVEEEVDADELAADVTMRLSQCNQDLSLLADVFDQLDDEKREALLTQLKYSIDLVAFLESKK
ncbi:MAG: ParB N-terminal domain-containing protein [Archangium sp.]|nr:ParB N-terminal domain-containing protein [Archangium sp.]